jgi:hypothetical protein
MTDEADLSPVQPAVPPLGPGDDDPRSPVRGVAGPARPPLGPGDTDGPNPDEEFDFIAPSPPGPGEAQTGPRHVVRIPKKRPPPTADFTGEQE